MTAVLNKCLERDAGNTYQKSFKKKPDFEGVAAIMVKSFYLLYLIPEVILSTIDCWL